MWLDSTLLVCTHPKKQNVLEMMMFLSEGLGVLILRTADRRG